MKTFSPAAERNRGPIADVLALVLPEKGRVLEIASGSGQHVMTFAERFPEIQFIPSDPSAEARASIEARRVELAPHNVASPMEIDTARAHWQAAVPGPIHAVIAINMIHIAPWAACEGLFRGARALLAAGAPLVLYGPFRFHGAFLAESNAAFSADLSARDPRWGVRDVDDVTKVANEAGFDLASTTAMPANNHALVFRAR